MNNILGLLTSKFRIKVLKNYIFLCTSLAVIFCGLSFYFEVYVIRYALLFTLLFCLISYLLLKRKPGLSRFIFLCNYIISVFLCAIFFGKSAGFEIFYTFFYFILFVLFSFRKEKTHLYSFIFIATLFWFILIKIDFTYFEDTGISALDAKRIIYPIAYLGNFTLILINLIYFSYKNSKLKKIENESKNNALALLKLKTIFLNGINEEIRQPLNSIIGLTHILKENAPRDDQQKNIKSLNLSGKNLLELLNNVLNLNELESSRVKLRTVTVDLKELLTNIIDIHKTKCIDKNITLTLSIDDTFPELQLDKLRYTQVLNNLISNAIKFTHKGSICVQITQKEIANNTIIFTTQVTDTGIGIPRDSLNMIWDKFTQATESTSKLYGGTGLGLPIVKNIVESMGGEIMIESELNRGTKFYFDITTKLKNISFKKETEAQTTPKLSGKRILVTDDNKINILVCKQILEKENIIVEESYNGFEALEAVRKTD
ncbi:MAG: ATP-binding protein, partial [Polaribacter sp.]